MLGQRVEHAEGGQVIAGEDGGHAAAVGEKQAGRVEAATLGGRCVEHADVVAEAVRGHGGLVARDPLGPGVLPNIGDHRDAGMPQGHQVVDDEPGTLAVVADDSIDPGGPRRLRQRDQRGRPGRWSYSRRTPGASRPRPVPGAGRGDRDRGPVLPGRGARAWNAGAPHHLASRWPCGPAWWRYRRVDAVVADRPGRGLVAPDPGDLRPEQCARKTPRRTERRRGLHPVLPRGPPQPPPQLPAGCPQRPILRRLAFMHWRGRYGRPACSTAGRATTG